MAGSKHPIALMPDGDSLIDRVLAHGCEFEFFHAVWLLERDSEGRVHVGERGPVAEEAFRFRPDVSLGFPPSDVRSITAYQDPVSGETFYQFDVTFMGLYGVSTPLPLHYATEILRSVEGAPAIDQSAESGDGDSSEREYAASRTPVRDFLDILHHRLISLFYRSWLKYRFDRSFAISGRDVLRTYLLWLIGCSPSVDRAALGVTPVRMLRYAGVLTQHPKSAAALEGVLVDYWQDYPIQIEQCVGRWVPIAPEDQNRLGASNCSLGLDFSAGEQVYDLNGAFCISVGPVDWQTYLSFLPDGQRFAETRSVTALFCSDPLSFSVEMKLHAGEIPEMRLTSDEQASRLGYTSWARTAEIPETSVLFFASSVQPTLDESGNQDAMKDGGTANEVKTS